MKKWVLSVILFIICFASPVAGQERIDSFHTLVNIQKDGTIQVWETIEYDFGSTSRHGIFRTIPLIKTNKDGKKYKLEIKDVGVVAEKISITRSAELLTIKIGDPDKTITGKHTYKIYYLVRGALTYFSDHDELYWNSTGDQWTVPIGVARAEIRLPAPPAGTDFKLACYTGSFGSTNANCTFNTNQNSALFSTIVPLQPSEGLTVVVGFPKNMVAVLEAKPYMTFWETQFGKMLKLFLIATVSLIALFWYVIYPIKIVMRWMREGRDPKEGAGEVRAWYDPPTTKAGRKLSPAETGTLIDEVADQKDIAATVIDLARRGYLAIEERKKNDFYFKKKKSYDQGLEEFERELLSGIFSTKDEVRLKDKKLFETVTKMKQSVYAKLVSDGFFPKNPEKIRTFYTVIGVFALTTFNIPLAIISFIFGRAMPVKTAYGAQAAQIARGLRNFLTSQERQLEHMAKNQINFEKLLPFAVAFGAEKIWATRFKDIVLKEPEWYTGYDSGSRFSSIYLADRLSSSFSSLSSAATPVSSSTGHSSGFSGGSSGGGGGGGGGGSW